MTVYSGVPKGLTFMQVYMQPEKLSKCRGHEKKKQGLDRVLWRRAKNYLQKEENRFKVIGKD